MRIGLLSDTHGFLDQEIAELLAPCDEIWHAGDFGGIEVADRLARIHPLVGVYGNIDGRDVRIVYPEEQVFVREGITIYMTHIAGYPGRYAARVKARIKEVKPDLVVCGHSHILKILRDPTFGHLHVNPGAVGHHGFHLRRTLLRFQLSEGRIHGMEVADLGKRGQI